MTRKKGMILAGVVVAAVAAFAYWRLRPPEPPTFVQAAVTRADVEQKVTATGKLVPLDKVLVGTETSGRIARVLVDFNTPVKRGDLLAQIDPEKLTARVQQLQAAVDAAQNEAKYQQSQLERAQRLVASGASVATDLETAEYRAVAAQTSLRRAQSELSQAQVDLANAKIRSPIDGIVLDRAVEEGQTVAASLNAPTLFTIARNLVAMEIEAEIDEADIGKVAVGQKVRFRVDAYPDRPYEGAVKQVRLSPVTVANVVTYTALVSAPNADRSLVPGMTANLEILIRSVPNALTIPMQALRFQPTLLAGAPEGPDSRKAPAQSGRRNPEAGTNPTSDSLRTAWRNTSQGPTSLELRTGLDDGVRIEILQGLAEGDSVIVNEFAPGSAAVGKGAPKNPFMPTMPKRPKGMGSGGGAH
jgi:HlyD family secretion protein